MRLASHAERITRMPEELRRCATGDNWIFSGDDARQGSSTAGSIFEALERISKSVPDHALRKVPADGSINYRKYLYG